MLKQLELQYNNFSGGFPLWVANSKPLVYLQELYLSHNTLSGVIPPWLFTLPSWESLDLSSNRLTGQIPEFQHDLPLDSLDLSDNKLRGPIPKSISTIANLTRLFLASNDLSGVVDPQTLKNVVYLSLSNTNLSMIAGSNVNTTIPNLRDFYMSSCNIEVLPDFLRTSENLEKLDLSDNRIHGQIPDWVGFIGKASLCLTGHIPASLGDLASLESLDISSNQLTGRIPSQLRSLTFLAVLNLSWNHLHGPIPQGLQFNTFGNGSYAGNLGLCGFPLSKECEDNQTKVEPPVSQKQEGDSDLDGFTWKIVVIGYGCGMTLGLFLGSLMFLIGRPKFFVRFAEIEMPKKVTRLRRLVGDTTGRRK
ncbi:hypothetical protein RHGRI_000671 [Rhododendron griersonianum]|uniref:Receptor-like protein 12 n=1 Tax=Rhododendron griersonianum TaxID=479676 RepID=A0AAV6LHJ5_9ERIC|nr:hypothetical protein RHGRI_000671 [Rhododendron griersonianum]